MGSRNAIFEFKKEGRLKMVNAFVEFYEIYGVSPVSQDISDLDKYILGRWRLYQLLGINARSFRDSMVSEVGAGSGYNTLVFLFGWD